MQALALQLEVGRFSHPNDVDRKRIERAVATRSRYRYVSPSVLPVARGYRIESPCCSRNIDAEGGVVDIALIQYEDDARVWRLYQKNHAEGRWDLHDTYTRLPDLLDRVKSDPDRQFWQ